MGRENLYIDYMGDGKYAAFVLGNIVDVDTDPGMLAGRAWQSVNYYGMLGVVLSQGVALILGMD